jgi:predicted ArsR family transcriptional regulator
MPIPDLIDAQIFVAERGQASCHEMMAEFDLTYPQAVRVMDQLEMEGVVEAWTPGMWSGPRRVVK